MFVVAGALGVSEGSSVRLRLAVALASELGFPLLVTGNGVVIFGFSDTGMTGGVMSELEAAVGVCSAVD